jgi:eukaryotic-like serine/threonine-protein kinase
MGVVYLGRDTRLDRAVAIKVLPDQLARDPERLARFEREARLLASLTHPNIAGIYGLEDADGVRFLVLEYVEGDTLAQRLQRGALPIDETLDVGCQIAHALEAAHEAGIVHRDLKPGNVKLTPGGAVKVLDFGLAKSGATAADSSPDLTQSPTLTYAGTAVGVILGTAAYMSPEQARGKPVDRRTDIWSFGCVLFECLTGKQAFAGETVSDVIALILQGEPDWAALPARTPEKLRHLIARCLDRDPRRRLRDIGDARIEIEELQGKSSVRASGAHAAPAEPAPIPSTPRAHGLLWALGALLLLAGASAGALVWNAVAMSSRADAPLRFTIPPPARSFYPGDPNELAISPDGRTLAFVASDSAGNNSLWVRSLGDFEGRELPGTRDASIPFWSPDSRQVGFFADGKLKRVRLSGGTPEPICDAATGRGASWNTDDVIVFSGSPTGPLHQVRASGGTPLAVTELDSTRGETAHRWPCFLPDGVHFIYAALPDKQGLHTSYVGSLRSKGRTALLDADDAAIYAAPGYLLFARSGAIMAQRFDVRGRKPSGEAFPVGEAPGLSNYSGAPGLSVSTTGVLAWLGAASTDRRLVWLDRGGHEIGAVDIPVDQWEITILSRDGRQGLAEKGTSSGGKDLWVIELERGIATRLTTGKARNTVGAFSPDGKQVAYGSTEKGARDLYVRSSDGTGTARVLYESAVPYKDPVDWSADGQWIVMQEIGDDTGWNLSAVPVGGGAPQPLAVSSFNEQFGQLSPDGAWLAYISTETGTPQAFVQSFPSGGMKQQVSKTGGIYAQWSAGGRELVIVRPDASVASVAVAPGPPMRFGPPRELFHIEVDTRSVVPMPDGQRFLAVMPVERTRPGISVAVNWRAGHEE